MNDLILSLRAACGSGVHYWIAAVLVLGLSDRLKGDSATHFSEERQEWRESTDLEANVSPVGDGLVVIQNSSDDPLDEVASLVRRRSDGSEKILVSTTDLERAFGYSFDLITNPVFDAIDGSVFFSATIGFVPIGIYQINQGELRQIVEPDSPIVNLPGQPLRAFRPEASYRGGLVFSAIRNVTESNGLFRYRGEEIQSLVGLETLLPGSFGNGDRVEFKALQGNRIWFEKKTRSVPPDYGLFVRESDESINLILRRGDPIPRTTDTYLNTLSVDGTRDRLVVLANSVAGEVYLLEFRDGVLKTLARPGDRTSTGEIISEIGLGTPIIELGRIYFGRGLEAQELGGSFQAERSTGDVYCWENGEIHKISKALSESHVSHENVFYVTETSLQARQMIQSRDLLEIPAVRYRQVGNTLVFDIQDEFELEFSREPGKLPWQLIGDSPKLEWPIMGPHGFFRLRHF